jgi:hypothetical protein
MGLVIRRLYTLGSGDFSSLNQAGGVESRDATQGAGVDFPPWNVKPQGRGWSARLLPVEKVQTPNYWGVYSTLNYETV